MPGGFSNHLRNYCNQIAFLLALQNCNIVNLTMLGRFMFAMRGSNCAVGNEACSREGASVSTGEQKRRTPRHFACAPVLALSLKAVLDCPCSSRSIDLIMQGSGSASYRPVSLVTRPTVEGTVCRRSDFKQYNTRYRLVRPGDSASHNSIFLSRQISQPSSQPASQPAVFSSHAKSASHPASQPAEQGV